MTGPSPSQGRSVIFMPVIFMPVASSTRQICAYAIAVDEEYKNPKITEFGFSRLYITPSDGTSHSIMDSIDAPEVLVEKKPHSYASDIFW